MPPTGDTARELGAEDDWATKEPFRRRCSGEDDALNDIDIALDPFALTIAKFNLLQCVDHCRTRPA